ncbi:hypothetical protein LO772_05810 [Yinghuangia sp. ASG 101]|uniref:hypothetical protein n=1 Tax=Yinghuangia sp. ASG 101 TaxID=2896848 RepID=UPI001E3CAC89|nr:hypothetical protein [Yinghuangia sp. ASG 101]UGQ13132.1 hypothetical protein LO772_05810 [Yinghuangia sp. ASG 101]
MRRIWGGEGADGLGVHDALLKDTRLSVPARGLAVHLLLSPEFARPDPARLASRPAETAASIAGYLAELESAGYLHRRTLPGGADGPVEEITLHTRPCTAADSPGTPGRVFVWPG